MHTTTDVIPAHGSFIAISVFDPGEINLDEWVSPGPARDTIELFSAAGWRPVTLAGTEGDRVTAIFYERILDDYEDRCATVRILIDPDGSYSPLN